MTSASDPSHSFRCSNELWNLFETYCQSTATSRTKELENYMQYCVMKFKMENGIVPKAVQKSIDYAVNDKVEKHSIVLLQEILGAMRVKSNEDMNEVENLNEMLD